MKTLIIAGAAMFATAAVAQAPTTTGGDEDPNETICRVVTETGSRLNRSRVCMTRAQWAQHRRETRANVERQQQVANPRNPSG